jgi:methionyl aminopeptidase
MIIYKTKEQIQAIREGGKILAAILDHTISHVKPGISTGELNEIAEKKMNEFGGVPSFKGYHPPGFSVPFPAVICASLNDQIVHGIPSYDEILQEGDIISLDIGMIYKKCYTDMAKTVAVGTVTEEVQQLLDVTKTSLEKAIEQVKPGNTVQDIGRAVEEYVTPFGFGIVRGLVGHGVGTAIWEEPQIPNYIQRGTDKIKLQPGMVIAIEPMLNLGCEDFDTLDDDWTIATRDESLSAHFEHTIIITEDGHEIATQ